MPEPCIQFRSVVVSYHDTVALRGVSLNIERGEFAAIIGPNGAGKTTLLTVVNGMTRLSGGSVRVLGQDLNGQGRHELRKKVGYVPQLQVMDRLMPVLVREAVIMGRYGAIGPLKGPTKQDWRFADEALEMVGMSHLAGRPIGHLSGGEQQRVAIARCLAQQPEVFLLDEPAASLDWKAQSEILDLVKRIHGQRGLTTLMVTHDLDALPHGCDHVVLIKKGTIIGDGHPEDMITTERLSELFDIPPAIVEDRRPHVHGRDINHVPPGERAG